MSKKDETLKLALEALKYPLNQSHENFNVDMAELLAHRAITAIKEAMAEQPAPPPPPPPPECQTEAEKTAFAFGWFKALEQKRKVDSALDRMAENARELGLDYEPIVEQVEDSVGMGHGAWDMVEPKKLAKAFHEALAEQPAQQELGGPSGHKLSDFQEGQWWLRELDAAVAGGTCDQKRAVAVVRNMLATAQAHLAEQPAQQEQVAWRWSESGGVRWFDWTTDWSHYDRAKEMGFPIQYAVPQAQRKPLTDEEQIAEALRRHSLTLVKTAKGYDVMSLGHITAHGITKGTK